MKKFFLLGISLVSLSAMAQEEKSFSIKGNLTNFQLPVAKVFLSYRAGDKSISDSIVPVNGTYTFTGKISEPTMAGLRVKLQPAADGSPIKAAGSRDFATVFLSPVAEMKCNSVDSFSNFKFTGSPAHEDYLKLNETLKFVNDLQRAASAVYTQAAKDKNEPARKAAENQLDSLDNVSRQIYGEFVKNNVKSPIAPFALSRFAGWDINVAEVEPLLKQMPAEVQSYSTIKNLNENLAIAKKTGVGAMAMDFTQNDTLGVPVKLSAFRGKYLLVDFWASWCGPCRRENPNVVKAFLAYKDKGFHILGVSLDQPGAKEKWLKAIHDDNLTWTHVSDLQYWKNAVAVQYGIQAIPQNYLLDRDGKIVAKNLRGEELNKKLADLLK